MSNGALRTAFDLPFAVRVNTAPARQPLQIQIGADRNLEEGDFRRIEAHVQVYVAAALFGMGGGAMVPPRFADNLDVTQVLRVNDGFPTPASASFEAAGLAIDLHYVPVLFHKLYCLARYFVPITSVVVQAPVPEMPMQEIRVVRGEESDLPGVFRRISFDYNADLESCAQSMTISATFERAIDESVSSILKRACDTWLAQCAQGGFISPTYGAENFFIAVNDDLSMVNNELVWGLDKVQIDSRAFNGLANLFAAFSERFTRVTSVSIE